MQNTWKWGAEVNSQPTASLPKFSNIWIGLPVCIQGGDPYRRLSFLLPSHFASQLWRQKRQWPIKSHDCQLILRIVYRRITPKVRYTMHFGQVHDAKNTVWWYHFWASTSSKYLFVSFKKKLPKFFIKIISLTNYLVCD